MDNLPDQYRTDLVKKKAVGTVATHGFSGRQSTRSVHGRTSRAHHEHHEFSSHMDGLACGHELVPNLIFPHLPIKS